MNFDEFETNVEDMKKDIVEAGVNPVEVKIQYTRVEGNQLLWAMHKDNIITYFKW